MNVELTNVSLNVLYTSGPLVGSVQDEANITNCIVDGILNGDSSSGGMIGAIRGNSTSDASIVIQNCHTSVNVACRYRSGGFVGTIGGKGSYIDINECSSTGTVTALGNSNNKVGGFLGHGDMFKLLTITNSYSTGDVSGGGYIGGFAGDLEPYTTNFTHPDFENTIANCYATGSVTGTGSSIGGFIGGMYQGYHESCKRNLRSRWTYW